jgi:hypothetical protein
LRLAWIFPIFEQRFIELTTSSMPKKFNITGLCLPAKHYMADISEKLAQVLALVEEGEYFAISRPRQYGKTTMLYSIDHALRQREGFLVLNISFEGIGDKVFEDEAIFTPAFVRQLVKYMRLSSKELSEWLIEAAPQTDNLEKLSYLVSDLVSKAGQKVVLLIDEVDKSSNNQLFISFLAMLRNKFLERELFPTFHSVVLAGVHDVKTLKAKLRVDEEAKQNSPWNIAAEFKVTMSLLPHEIVPMLEDYAQERGVALDAPALAERLYYYTSGYPFLVSKLCKIVDEDLLPRKAEQSWGGAELEQAAYQLLSENNTNFDSLVKNMENNPALYDLAFEIIVNGAAVPFNPDEPVAALGRLYGIFKDNGLLTVHNRIYEQRLYNYMTAKAFNEYLKSEPERFAAPYSKPGNRLDLEAVLLKFQQYMKEQYSRRDQHFLERQWRLIFLAFLKPILNGKGHDFKEVQTAEEKRLDIIVTYYQHKYVIELKRWYGDKAHQRGLAQLADYLEIQGLDEGYLVIFDPRRPVETILESSRWAQEWIEAEGKRVFTVWV